MVCVKSFAKIATAVLGLIELHYASQTCEKRNIQQYHRFLALSYLAAIMEPRKRAQVHFRNNGVNGQNEAIQTR